VTDMSTVDGWESMAERWDANEGDEGSNWYRLCFIQPSSGARSLAGRRVLDVGCGNGSLARQEPKSRAWMPRLRSLFERSSEAQEKLGIDYHVADAAPWSRLVIAGSTSWSLVWRCRTFLMPPRRSGGGPYCAHGAFCGLFSHPCFDVPEASAGCRA
jgi:SAM-dependent methyltransferase